MIPHTSAVNSHSRKYQAAAAKPVRICSGFPPVSNELTQTPQRKKALPFRLAESNSLLSRGLWEYCSIPFLSTLPKARVRKTMRLHMKLQTVSDEVFVVTEVNKTGNVDKR
jgi:hypothetical protein